VYGITEKVLQELASIFPSKLLSDRRPISFARIHAGSPFIPTLDGRVTRLRRSWKADIRRKVQSSYVALAVMVQESREEFRWIGRYVCIMRSGCLI
jgi:hypothetical protein